jgi:cellulose synthase/poly-beta-1,6-N-acetylglucosamine synthase-like glycosyltransferase
MVLVGLLLASLLAVIVVPLRRTGDADAGDGLGVVALPPAVRTPPTRPRTVAFLLGVVVASVLLVAVRKPSLQAAFTDLVAAVVSVATGSGLSGAAASSQVSAAVPLLGAAYLVVLSVVIRATLGRRILLAAHAVLLLCTTAVAQGLLVVLTAHLGNPSRALGFESLLVDLTVGALVNARAIVTTFCLPRPSALPRRRPRWWSDTVVAASAVAAAGAVVALGFAWLETQPAGSIGHVLAPAYGVTILFLLSPALLVPLGWLETRRPAPDPSLAFDVITPAYNEAAGIQDTLASIDRAAAVHGAPVRVIVSDDGSTDGTAALAREAIARFTAASGMVVSYPNGGKSVALNRALALTTAPVVVRIDGDCVMGEHALAYSSGWFADPVVGSVGALMLPVRQQTWLDRMRTVECLFQFGLVRQGQQVVDAMGVIPGTYVAFRREPALEIGGFTDGMNGEDAELIMQFGRMGYRAVLDPRVRSYEDVPADAGAFLEQRTRWSRGGVHVAARHNPLAIGSAGPRVWLVLARRIFSWLSIVIGLSGPMYLAVLALLRPSYRHTVLTVASLYLVAAGLYLAVSVGLLIRHRRWSLLPWLPAWYAFALLRRIAMLEALITLPCRPLRRRQPPSVAPVPVDAVAG